MKNKIYYILLSALVLLGVGCSSDSEVKLNQNDFVEPVLSAKFENGVVIEEENFNKVIGTFSWEEADFGVATPVKYYIYADLSQDFENKILAYTATGKDLSITQKQLNDVALKLVEEQKEMTVYFKMIASIGSTVSGTQLAASEIVKVTFTNAMVVDFGDIFMTGSKYNWGGTWNQLIPINDTPGEFWGIYHFEADEEIKFAPQAGWGNDFGFTAKISQESIDLAGLSDEGGNIKVGNAGWYIIHVSVQGEDDKTVAFYEPNVYLMGDAANAGWSIDKTGLFTVPEAADGEFVSPGFAKDAELRICISITEKDWWRTEFMILDGSIEYRGNGGDQERVNVTAGQKAYLNFKDGTGRIE